MDNKTLETKAEEFAPFLIALVEKTVSSLMDGIVQFQKARIKSLPMLERFRVNKQTRADRERLEPVVRHEILCFIVHLTDRLVSQLTVGLFGREGEEERGVFMDSLVRAICQCLLRICRSEVVIEWPKSLNARQAEYSQYQLILAEESYAKKKDLFWAFTKKIVFLLELSESSENDDRWLAESSENFELWLFSVGLIRKYCDVIAYELVESLGDIFAPDSPCI